LVLNPSFLQAINTDILPASDATYSIGSASLRWLNCFLAGDLTVNGSGSFDGNLTVSGLGIFNGNYIVNQNLAFFQKHVGKDYTNLTFNAYYDGTDWIHPDTTKSAYLFRLNEDIGKFEWYFKDVPAAGDWTLLMELDIGGNVSLTGNLSVGGDGSFTGNVNVGEDLFTSDFELTGVHLRRTVQNSRMHICGGDDFTITTDGVHGSGIILYGRDSGEGHLRLYAFNGLASDGVTSVSGDISFRKINQDGAVTELGKIDPNGNLYVNGDYIVNQDLAFFQRTPGKDKVALTFNAYYDGTTWIHPDSAKYALMTYIDEAVPEFAWYFKDVPAGGKWSKLMKLSSDGDLEIDGDLTVATDKIRTAYPDANSITIKCSYLNFVSGDVAGYLLANTYYDGTNWRCVNTSYYPTVFRVSRNGYIDLRIGTQADPTTLTQVFKVDEAGWFAGNLYVGGKLLGVTNTRMSVGTKWSYIDAGSYIEVAQFYLPAGSTLKVWGITGSSGNELVYARVRNVTDGVTICNVLLTKNIVYDTGTPLATVQYAAKKFIWFELYNSGAAATSTFGIFSYTVE